MKKIYCVEAITTTLKAKFLNLPKFMFVFSQIMNYTPRVTYC